MYVALEKRIGLKAEYARTRTNPVSLGCTYRIIYSPLIFFLSQKLGELEKAGTVGTFDEDESIGGTVGL